LLKCIFSFFLFLSLDGSENQISPSDNKLEKQFTPAYVRPPLHTKRTSSSVEPGNEDFNNDSRYPDDLHDRCDQNYSQRNKFEDGYNSNHGARDSYQPWRERQPYSDNRYDDRDSHQPWSERQSYFDDGYDDRDNQSRKNRQLYSDDSMIEIIETVSQIIRTDLIELRMLFLLSQRRLMK
jgi:hypothetical protein